MYGVSCLLSIAVVVSAAESDSSSNINELGSARIVASKMMLSQYAVEEKEFIMDYRLYNIGDKPALRVELDDRANFPTQHFDIVKGQLLVKWPRINPGANVTHSVVIKPLEAGSFNYTAAMITYLPSDDAQDVRYALTTAPGEGYIYRLRDYERKFSPHYSDWAVFALMALPCLGLPFMLWYKTYKKYDGAGLNKKQK